MEELSWSPALKDRQTGSGCSYILGDDQGRHFCGQPLRPGSSYCPQHHALCHVACGTTEEAWRLREVEALAHAVGGRRAPEGGGPSRRFLNRLEHAMRIFL
jgi:hypothetical protein